MATKTIKAWINGVVQEIEVEDIMSPEQEPSVEERLDKLEDKPIITDGNLLVGNGTKDLEEMTPEEVLSHINGASVETMTTDEYNALGDGDINANTLYALIDTTDDLIEVVDSLPEKGIKDKIYLVPNSNDLSLKNSFDEYVWIENNNSAQLNKGELIGTVNEEYGEWIGQVEWINLDETFPLDIYEYHIPVDNRTNLYVNIPPFPGAYAALLLSDEVNYYGIVICDYDGGEIYAYIEGNTLYIKRANNTETESFEVTSETKIVGIACIGEMFENNELTLYECIKGSGIWEIIGISQEELTNYIENKKFKTEIVTELPPTEEAKENILYMVPTLSHDIFIVASLDSVEWHYNEGNKSPYYGQNTEVIYNFSSNVIGFEEYGIVVNLPDDFDTRYLTTGNTVKFNYTDSNEPLTDFKIYSQKHCYDEFVFVNGEFERVGLEINYDNYATKDYVDQEIATFDFIKVVDKLPTEGLLNRIYFVPKTTEDSEQENDLFDEYVWMNIGTEADPVYDWEWITTKQLEIDLTNYVEKVDGKGLSTNDFTNAHKTKLDSIVTTDTPKTIDGDVTGEMISVNDVHPVEQDVEVKLSSKNLIPYPYATEDTRRGITFTPNADGTVTVNGQNDGTGYSRLTFTPRDLVLPVGTYILHSGDTNCVAGAQILKADGSYKYASNSSFVLEDGDKITYMWVQVLSGNTTVFDNVIVKPQLERGTTATAYTPYKGNFEDVTVSALGKNLLPKSAFEALGFDMTNEECDYYAATAVPFHNKVIYKNTSGYTGQFRLNYQVKYISPNTSGGITFRAVYTDGTIGYLYNKAAQFDDYYTDGRLTDAGKVLDYIAFGYGTGAAQTFFKDVQLELGATITDYEEPIEPVTYTANADGTVDNVRSIAPNMTITTDTVGILVNAKYNKDINKTINLAPFGDEDRQIATIGDVKTLGGSNMDVDNVELITVDDIDAICGSTISYANLSEGAF